MLLVGSVLELCSTCCFDRGIPLFYLWLDSVIPHGPLKVVRKQAVEPELVRTGHWTYESVAVIGV